MMQLASGFVGTQGRNNDFPTGPMEEATKLLPENDSPSMYEALGCLCNTAANWTCSMGSSIGSAITNPWVNSAVSTISSGVAAYFGTALILELFVQRGAFDGPDGCNSDLGNTYLNLGLTAGFLVVTVGNSVATYIGAQQLYEKLVEARSNPSNAMTFSRDGGTPVNTSSDDIQIKEEVFCTAPKVAILIDSGTKLFGLSFGAIVKLLVAPTQLSGCDVSTIKIGSYAMIAGAALLVPSTGGVGCLTYKNLKNTNQMIAETQAFDEVLRLSDSEQEGI